MAASDGAQASAVESLRGCAVELRALAELARGGSWEYDFAALDNVAATMERALDELQGKE